MKKLVIVGPGALGSLLAATLADSGDQLWLLDHNAERAAFLAARGILMEENGRIVVHCHPRVTSAASEIGPAETVLLCVKSTAVEAALRQAEPLFAKRTLLVAFQNGIGHLPLLSSFQYPGTAAVGVTSQGATLVSPGLVRHGGSGLTHLGFLAPPPAAARRVLEALVKNMNAGGMTAQAVEEIRPRLWTKLLINVGINALTALHDCSNGGLLETAERRNLMEAAVLEASAVARRQGIPVPRDPVAAVVEVCRATAANISSMLQDVRRQRPTEIEAINGAVLNEARRLGLEAPVNEELVLAVKTLEQGFPPKTN